MSSVYSLPFSPTRSVTTLETEDSNPARALFHEDDVDADALKSTASVSGNKVQTSKSIPLSTITNNRNHKAHFTISTSPPPSVAELKARLKKKVEAAAAAEAADEKKKTSSAVGFSNDTQSKENIGSNSLPKLPTRSTPHPSKRFHESFQKNANVPPPSPSLKHTVSIPMNKVTEMKKFLQFDFETTNRMREVQMSSKKRAKIEERLNQVSDIQKWLTTLERKQNKNSNPKAELKLPVNRVREMKSWLADFEQQKKAHADFYVTDSKENKLGLDNGRSHIPRIGFRYQPFEAREKTDGDLSRAEVDTSELPQVSELKQILIDFEAKNKAHYDKHNTRPSFEYRAWKKAVTKSDTEFEEIENELKDAVLVTNTSFVENDDKGQVQRDLNISMMPAHDDFDDSAWDDDEEEDDELSETSSHVEINIAPIDSCEVEEILSEDESEFIESKLLEKDGYDDDEISEEESEVFEDNFNELSSSHSIESSVLSAEAEEEDELISVAEEAMKNAKETTDFVIHEKNNEESLVKESISDCSESCSKLEVSDDDDEYIEATLERNRLDHNSSDSIYDDDTFDMSDGKNACLIGEKFVAAPIAHFTEHEPSHQIRSHENTAVIVHSKVKTKAFKKFLKALKKFLSSLKLRLQKSKAVVLFEQEYSGDQPLKVQNSLKPHFIASHQQYSRNKYIPGIYQIQASNFQRDVAQRAGEQVRVYGDSPGSLASAFRRTLSPSSSAVSGFTDVEGYAIRNYQSVSEHVSFLKKAFNAQTPLGQKSEM